MITPRWLCVLVAAAPLAAEPPDASLTSLPPVVVQSTPPKLTPWQRFYNRANNLFAGPFLEVRGGPLIEAILFEHHYLSTHPGEQAIVVPDRVGDRVAFAATVYTENGKVYASSQVVGTHARLAGFAPADLLRPGRARARLAKMRASYESAAEVRPVQYGSLGAENEWALEGVRMVNAERTNDYEGMFRWGIGPIPAWPTPVSPELNPFTGPDTEVLLKAFVALRDPAKAGLIPVALNHVNADVTRDHATEKENFDALVFEWNGVHYFYNPDRGTYGMPIPRDPVTRTTYLCLNHGDQLESVNFCAAFGRTHPGERVTLLSPTDGPYGAAYTDHGALHLFSPYLGKTRVPGRLGLKVDDTARLEELLGLLVRRQEAQLAARHQETNANAIPHALAGDDAGLQAVRAYLSLTANGVATQLKPHDGTTGLPGSTLSCQWQGRTYRYDFTGPIPVSITVAQR